MKTDAGLTAASYVLYQSGQRPTTSGTTLPTNAKFSPFGAGVATELTTVIGVLEQLGLRDKLKLVNPSSVQRACRRWRNNTLRRVIPLVGLRITRTGQAINNLGSSIDMVVTDPWNTGYSNSARMSSDNKAAFFSISSTRR